LPTTWELCRQFDASRTAVRKALHRLQAEGLVTIRPGRGVFVAGKTAIPRTRSAKSLTVSFITPAIDDPLPAAIQAGLADALSKSDIRLFVQSAEWSVSRELEIVRRLRHDDVQGAVILPTSGDAMRDEIEALQEAGWPFVLVDRTFEGIRSSSVCVDNIQGAVLAVQHLIELGHRRIGMIGHLSTSSNRDRHLGYRRALSSAGMAYDERLVAQCDQRDKDKEPRMGGMAEMEQLLAMPDPPTAVFAANDHYALGAIWAAQKAGLKVPGDLSVIGFDGLGMEQSVPGGLTTIRQPGKQIGQKAGELLALQLASATNECLYTTQALYLRAVLVPGATTAPPRKK